MSYHVPPERRRKPCRWRNWNALERSVITNGCGGKGGLLDPPEYLFTASCGQHDANYWLGGSDAQRLEADRQFLDAMLKDADLAPWYSRWWLKGAAWRYYWAVRLMGAKFFNYNVPVAENPMVTNRVRETSRWARLERVMTASGATAAEAHFD